MRHAFAVVSSVLLLGAFNASGQQSGETRGSIYISDFAFSHAKGEGVHLDEGGGGISVLHFFKPVWSVELSVGAERRHTYQRVIYPPDQPQPPYYFGRRVNFTSWPVDVVAQYHILNGTRWIPYVGAGLHYANAPDTVSFKSEVAGGVLFRMTPSIALRFDARQFIGNGDEWDPGFRPMVGVSWRFGGKGSPGGAATP